MRRGIRSGLTAALVASVVAAVRPGDAQVSSDAALIAQLIFQEKQAVAELTQIIQALQGQTQLLAQFLKGQPQGELDYVGSLLQGTCDSEQELLLKVVGDDLQPDGQAR